MKSNSIKRIIAFITSILMLSSYTTPVLAVNGMNSVFTSDESIICGYSQIYDDGASSSWAPVKPSVPNASQLTIQFESEKLGEEYSFKLMDGLGEDIIAQINGVSDSVGTNVVSLQIPGNTEGAIYKLLGKIGDKEESSKDLAIENNLALNAVVSSLESNNTLSKINDLTIGNYTVKGGTNTRQQVTLNPPVDMTFTFNSDSTVNHIDIYSNNVDNHGP